MRISPCDYRREIGERGAAFRCAHPRVHARDDIVTPELCRICAQWDTGDQPKPLAPIQRRPAAWRPWRPVSVAVVIVCHDYGHYVGEAIESALAQSVPPGEVMVVDDASRDETPEVAAAYGNRGVSYLRVEFRHSQLARRAGWLATRSDVLCFLDADDVLETNYIERGLAEFSDPSVGLVYSDVEFFGAERGRSDYPATYDRGLLARMNFLHTGCLVLREALDTSRAFDVFNDDRESLQDWLLWRRVLGEGWQAKKQAALYRYRRHGRSMTATWRAWGDNAHDYYQRASLARETLTLFVPLAGRGALWPQFAEFLDRQSWPHDQIRLVLFDSSQNAAFSRVVRGWLASCDYSDARHVRAAVGESGLADRPRASAAVEVTLAMTRIYNRLAREATTDYVWIVEDDVLPPVDACERLLRGFDQRTASVSGAYPSRFNNGYVVWQANQQKYLVRGRGVQAVGGNGFGCVVIRGDVLRETVFTATVDYPAYDNAFYHRLAEAGLAAKVDWSIECEHRVTGDSVNQESDKAHE